MSDDAKAREAAVLEALCRHALKDMHVTWPELVVDDPDAAQRRRGFAEPWARWLIELTADPDLLTALNLAPSSALASAERRGIERAEAKVAEYQIAADRAFARAPKYTRGRGKLAAVAEWLGEVRAAIRALSPLSGGADGEVREALRALVKDYRETVRCAVEIMDNLGWKADPVEKQLAGSNAYRTASALLARIAPAAEAPDA